jgi:hypothetical protein
MAPKGAISRLPDATRLGTSHNSYVVTSTEEEDMCPIVSSHKPGSKDWYSDRISYRMDGLGYPIFIVAMIVVALIGYHSSGFKGFLEYGAASFAISELIMQIAERWS